MNSAIPTFLAVGIHVLAVQASVGTTMRHLRRVGGQGFRGHARGIAYVARFAVGVYMVAVGAGSGAGMHTGHCLCARLALGGLAGIGARAASVQEQRGERNEEEFHGCVLLLRLAV